MSIVFNVFCDDNGENNFYQNARQEPSPVGKNSPSTGTRVEFFKNIPLSSGGGGGIHEDISNGHRLPPRRGSTLRSFFHFVTLSFRNKRLLPRRVDARHFTQRPRNSYSQNIYFRRRAKSTNFFSIPSFWCINPFLRRRR